MSKGRLPILHIEAHGDYSGFEIARSKEEVTWTELNNKLAEINFAARNNIVLSLGICHGHYINIDLANRFRNRLRCAYTINISPERKIDWNDILVTIESTEVLKLDPLNTRNTDGANQSIR